MKNDLSEYKNAYANMLSESTQNISDVDFDDVVKKIFKKKTELFNAKDLTVNKTDKSNNAQAEYAYILNVDGLILLFNRFDDTLVMYAESAGIVEKYYEIGTYNIKKKRFVGYNANQDFANYIKGIVKQLKFRLKFKK